MSIADRALAAHQADEEAKRLRREALTVERKAQAFNAISQAAEPFGVDIEMDALKPESVYLRNATRWRVEVPIEPDVTLRFWWEWTWQEIEKLTINVKVTDQLYWDLPPGQNEKGPGGGTYGCYGLGEIHARNIETLADLGAVIERVRSAREQWQNKHKTPGPLREVS